MLLLNKKAVETNQTVKNQIEEAVSKVIDKKENSKSAGNASNNNPVTQKEISVNNMKGSSLQQQELKEGDPIYNRVDIRV